MHARDRFFSDLSISHPTFAYCMYVFNSDGFMELNNYVANNPNLKMPMVSTVKSAVAVALAKKVHEGVLNLDTVYLIKDEDLVPGLPNNFLDGLFFILNSVNTEVTLRQLFTRMMTTSDNTSTDFILKLIGGPTFVTYVINEELGIKDFNCTSTMRDLLSNYYEIPCVKSPENIEKLLIALKTAFDMKSTEKKFFNDELDSCSSFAMAELLSKIAFPQQAGNPKWLQETAPWILDTMKLCATNSDKLKRGVESSNVSKEVQFCAGKTGSLGSILNDTGIVKISWNNKDIIFVLAIYSCLSPLPLAHRNELIANTTKELIEKFCELPLKLSKENF